MLLRFIVENYASFKDAVEFNTFPSSKSQSHDNHKIKCDHATALRMAAIYGANGAGKSNFLGGINRLKAIVENGSVKDLLQPTEFAFLFDSACATQPIGMAIEFHCDGNVFYYHVEFREQRVEVEELLLSKRTTDTTIFERNTQGMSINEKFLLQGGNATFVDGIARLVRPDMLLLSFLGKYYPDESQHVTSAYKWITEQLQVMLPSTTIKTLAHQLDTDAQLMEMVNTIIPKLKTGIDRLRIKKEILSEDNIKANAELTLYAKRAKDTPGEILALADKSGIPANIVFENGVIVQKTLVSIHMVGRGNEIELPLTLESDGTKRLIEYMMIVNAITNQGKVYIVDEIERSLHPIIIKDLISRLSASTDMNGQLIFSTHESSLLDQKLFRPDEIWFAQKDVDQSTQLYPLSDYNVHKTANIENGYLNGRYGGIPFLSNINDLHW